jgi:hypothetical protein
MADAWWLKPVLIGVLNLAVVVLAVTVLIGWSAPVIAVVVAGFGMGCWWLYEQRPKR